MAGATGLEPATNGFGDRYSTIELRTFIWEDMYIIVDIKILVNYLIDFFVKLL